VYKCGGCGTDLKGEKSILIILSKFYSNYVENYKNHM
jgi:hypothetical protein